MKDYYLRYYVQNHILAYKVICQKLYTTYGLHTIYYTVVCGLGHSHRKEREHLGDVTPPHFVLERAAFPHAHNENAGGGQRGRGNPLFWKGEVSQTGVFFNSTGFLIM